MKIDITEAGSIFGVLFMISVVIAAGFGWVMNVVEIFNIANGPITGMFVFRIIGIFVAPLGAILGYL